MLPAVPVLGDALRYTVALVAGALLAPGLIAASFDPAPVPPRFAAGFPVARTLRPGHIRAGAEDSGLLVPSAAALGRRYGELRLPVAIVAGAEDRIVDPGLHSLRLHREVPRSGLWVVPGEGHMVHHGAARVVAGAVEAVAAAAVLDGTRAVEDGTRHGRPGATFGSGEVTAAAVPWPSRPASIAARPFTCLANISIERNPSEPARGRAARAHAGRPDHGLRPNSRRHERDATGSVLAGAPPAMLRCGITDPQGAAAHPQAGRQFAAREGTT